MAADDAAVVVTLRANLKDYEAALKSAVRATERAAQAAETAVSGIGKTARPGNVIAVDFQKSAAQIQNDARIMQFQLNDVFSGLASGQGIRALQVQLGQIAQQLGGGGIRQAASTLGTALVGMINPVNLAVVAFGFAATAAASYFFGAEEGAEKAEKALKELNAELKRQAGVLKEVAAEWKEAPAAIQAAVNAQEQFEKLGKRRESITIARKDLLGPITDELRDAKPKIEDFFQLFESPVAFPQFAKGIKEISDRLELMFSQLESGGATVNEVRDFLDQLIAMLQKLPGGPGSLTAQLVEQLTRLRDKVADVTPQVGELDTAMNTLGQDASSVLSGMLTGFQALLGPLGPLVEALRALSGALPSDLGGAIMEGIVQMPEAFRQAVTASGDAAREFLRLKSANKEVADSLKYLDDRMAISTAKLFTLLPETARITSAVRSPQEQAELYARHLRDPSFQAARRSRHVPGQVTAAGTAVDIGVGVSMETLRAAVKMIPELEQLDKVSEKLYQKDKVHVQLAGTATKANEEEARSIIQKAEADVQAAEQRAAATARAQENLQTYLRSLDEQASLQVRINEINTTSTLNADQKRIAIEVETELQKALNQARQDGITLSQQDIDSIRAKAIANAQAGNAAIAISEAERAAAKEAADAAAAAKKATEDQARALENLKNVIAGMATQAIVGFVQDLRNGVDAAEALYNAVSRIADQLLQMALQMAFKAILGGMGGGMPMMFAKGGYTGDQSTRAPAGIVHGQEFVVNAAATQKHRDLLEAINRGVPGYASGGFVLPNLRSMAQQMSSSQSVSAQSVDARTTVVNTFDSGSFLSEALSKPDGVKVILNAVRAQPGAFRQAMNA